VYLAQQRAAVIIAEESARANVENKRVEAERKMFIEAERLRELQKAIAKNRSLMEQKALEEYSDCNRAAATEMAKSVPKITKEETVELIQGIFQHMLSSSIVLYWRKKFLTAAVSKQRREAAIKIQCFARRCVARRVVREERQRRVERIEAKNEALRRLAADQQAAAQQQYLQQQIQHQVNALNESKEKEITRQKLQREALKLMNSAALTIQCAYRSYNARFMRWWKQQERHEKQKLQAKRDHNLMANAAAIKIQSCTRRFVAKRRVQRLKEDKIAERTAIARLEARRHAAAVRIQCMYRCHNARFEVAWRREDRRRREEKALMMKKEEENKALRVLQAKEEQQRRLMRMRQAAITIQCAWRCYNARFELMWRVEAKAKKQTEAALRRQGLTLARGVQRYGRGYITRRRLYQDRALAHTLAAQELLMAEYEADSVINDVLSV
jgi:hypothetical protein